MKLAFVLALFSFFMAATNRRVYDILIKAGRDIYRELN